MLVYQNNETVTMLVFQTDPLGVGSLFLCKNGGADVWIRHLPAHFVVPYKCKTRI